MKHPNDIGSTGDGRRALGLPNNYEYNFAGNTYWDACNKLASARAIMQRFVNKVDDIDKDEMIDVEDICVEMQAWLKED